MTSITKFKRPNTLEELFADDPFGLLADVGEKQERMTIADKVKTDFDDVAQFITEHQRLPSTQTFDFSEELLALKYQELIKSNPDGQEYCESLLPEELRSAKVERIERTTLTRDELIKKQVEDMQSRTFESIDEIMQADPFNLLGDDACDDLPEPELWRHSPEYQYRQREIDEPTARASKCEEFEQFKPYFDEVKYLIADGHIKQERVIGSDRMVIEPGQFFVIDGVLSLIAEAQFDQASATKISGHKRYRVRQIFDNGTESRPFDRSVKASFYKGTLPSVQLVAADDIGNEFFQRMKLALDPQYLKSENLLKPQGFVYILGSLSSDPVIREYSQNGCLIKIGYTDRSVQERIANAQDSSTYLFAPVEVLASIQCHNLDANELEQALHQILAAHRLNVTLKDSNGGYYKPQEWFTVSVDTACEVVKHIIANDLANYYLDPIQGKLKLLQP